MTAVHNHGPEEGSGLSCRERLVGSCIYPPYGGIPPPDKRPWQEVERNPAGVGSGGIPLIDVELLARALHLAMCDVSHHDSQITCNNQRKYELIAESVHGHLVDWIQRRAENGADQVYALSLVARLASESSPVEEGAG